MADLSGKHILVTGGAGFIGRAVVGHLQAAGARVTVADLRPATFDGVDQVLGDLRSADRRDAALRPGMHGVVHLAALTSVLRSVRAPWDVHTTNVDMTAALLERARLLGVRHFVCASTNAVVGDVGTQRITEDLALRPLTPYGATKAAAEMLMSAYGASYDMGCASLRLSNVFGPGMDLKDSMVPRLMRAAMNGSPVEIYGDGEQVRDFVHVEDVARAFVLALTDGWAGPTIVAAGHSHSVNELVEMTRTVTGSPLPVEHVMPKAGEMPAVVVDPARALRLGWKAEISLFDGLRSTWAYFTTVAPTDAA